MAVFYDSGVCYDSGAYYDDVSPPPTRKKHMPKPRLNLAQLSYEQKLTQANEIKTSMTGNANFPTPVPTLAAYGTLITTATTKHAEWTDTQLLAKQKTVERQAAFDALDTALACLEIAAGMVRGLVFRPGRMLAALAGDMSAATEIADYLAGKGMPFRQAHHLSGEIVSHAESRGIGLDALTLEELQAFSPLIEVDLPPLLKPQAVVAAKTSQGGTAPERVREQLAKAKEVVG